MPVDIYMLARAFPKANGEVLDCFLAAMQRYGLAEDLRVAARYVAQVKHESIDLTHTEEIGGKKMKYAPYFGRGDIQLTWKSNYEAYKKASGLDVVTHPDLLADPEPAADSAAWFYTTHGLHRLTDFDRISTRINGAAITQKSLAARRVCYRATCKAFGIPCDVAT